MFKLSKVILSIICVSAFCVLIYINIIGDYSYKIYNVLHVVYDDYTDSDAVELRTEDATIGHRIHGAVTDVDDIHGKHLKGTNGLIENKTDYPEKASVTTYDEPLLLARIKEIHDSRYRPPIDETCQRRLPHCVILGIRKCGTQELIDFLSIHPNIIIRGKPVYEINCFLSDDKLSKCNHLMPCSYSDQFTLTKSSIYFTTPSVPKRLFKYNKTLKMILLVREPVERLIADYSFEFYQHMARNRKISVGNGTDVYTKMDALGGRVIDKKTGRVKANVPEIVRSTYDIPMKRYLNFFKREQILIIESSELKNNPYHVVRKVESFLGLEHKIRENDFVFNDEKGFHCVRSVNGMRCYGENRGRNKSHGPQVLESTRLRLHTFFKKHNQEFFKLIGKKYDWENN